MSNSLGLESGTVRVVPYDPAWPKLFALEAERLRRHFARKNLPIVIEHTGSTAVSGLAAKPILDILAGRITSPFGIASARPTICGTVTRRSKESLP